MTRLFRLIVIYLLITSAFAQTAEIVPNENLVAEGIPKIPAALADSVGRYSEFRSAFFTSWNPARREMLIVTRFADTNQIHQVSFPGGARKQLTFFPDRVGGGSYQPVTGDSFLFSKDIGGGEFFQIYRYDIATGEITLLTDGKSRNTSPRWSYQGDRIAYGSTQRTGNDVDVWVVSANDPSSAHLVSQMEGGGWNIEDWSPDGKQLLAANFVSAAESYVWLVDIASGKKELLTPKAGSDTVSYGNARFSKDGKGVYMTSDENSEFARLVYLDLASHKSTVLTPSLQWDIDELDLSKTAAGSPSTPTKTASASFTSSTQRPKKKSPSRKSPLASSVASDGAKAVANSRSASAPPSNPTTSTPSIWPLANLSAGPTAKPEASTLLNSLTPNSSTGNPGTAVPSPPSSTSHLQSSPGSVPS